MKLEIINGTKAFKNNVIIDNVSVTFEKGNIYGLQGDNGSGKTVILKTLAGYMTLDSGLIKQNDTVIRKFDNYITDAGIIIEKMDFLPYYSLIKNLKLLKNLSKNITDEAINH